MLPLVTSGPLKPVRGGSMAGRGPNRDEYCSE